MNLFRTIKNNFNQYIQMHPYRGFLNIALYASLIITIVVQSLECHSLLGGIAFIFSNTYFFILNYLIVFFTMTLAFLFKRRSAFMVLFGSIWILLGITNLIITVVRPMPLSGIDFVILTTTMDIIPHYLSIIEIILCIIGIILLIGLTVYWIYKSKKYVRNFKSCISPVIASTLLLAVFLCGGALNSKLEVSYADVKEAYDTHGFIYCFASSFVDKGISQPDDYSSDEVTQIIKKYTTELSGNTKTPNIIVVQLESFFDIAKYHKYELTEDPIRNFHSICEKHGEGAISVPSNGGGTVNTEFEVLTGMNLEFFGAVEYPYTSILKKKTCEAAAFILDDYGYTSHAIHNHTGVFYKRNEVYPNLGFDTFTPLEYMQYTDNELGWAKDEAVYESIINTINKTPGKDFIFAVTVEGHGMYVDEDRPDIPYKVSGRAEMNANDLKKVYMYEYYCSLLNETDKVIGKLYDYVMSSDEEFVVVLYGDHLPSIEFDSSQYDYKSDYSTTYTVFSNMTDFEYKYCSSIPANRLISSVFETLGIDGGVINKINRHHKEESYEYDLEFIQYDMLYGNGYSYAEAQYSPKSTRFGVDDIIIDSYVFDNGYLELNGRNFTKASKIVVNGWERDTEFVDSCTLRCSVSLAGNNDIISVRQCAVDGKALSEVFYIS